MLADVAVRSPAQAARIRRGRRAWVIAGAADGCSLRTVGYDGTDLIASDVAQVPHEIPEDELRELLAEAYRRIGSPNALGDRRAVLSAVREIARLFGEVARRCGPRGSVSDAVEMGLLWRPDGGVISQHLPPTSCAQVRDASDIELERLLMLQDGVTYQNIADVWTPVSPPPPTGAEFIKIVAALPTLPNASYPIDTVVLLQSDSKLYRNQANVWTSYVDGNDLTANSVTTNKILAGAVTAAKIAVTQLSAIAADLGSITAGQILLDLAASFLRYADAALAHGVTDVLPTTVYGSFAQLGAAHSGGLTIYGISGAASISGLIVDAISQASPTAPSVALYATKKSGTGRVALAAADPAFEVLTGPPGAATLLLHLRGDGQLQHADGSGSLPGLSFLSDTDTGAYRAGANDWRLAAGGADVVAIATALATVFKPMDVQGALRALAGGASSANVFRVPVVLFKAQALSHANVTESSVTSFSLPASTLDTDGYALRIVITGEVTGSNSGFPRLKFGATNLDANAAILTTHKFVLKARIVRTGAATQRAMLEWNDNGTITLLKTTPAETLSGAVTIDVRSSENTGGTTVFDSVIMELVAA